MLKLDVDTLIIRIPNWIGDAVMASAAIEAIRSKLPRARLVLVAKPWVSALFSRSRIINHLIEYPHHRGWNRGADLLKCVSAIRKEKPSAAILLQTSFESALMAWLARIPIRAGLPTDHRSWLLTDSVQLMRSVPKHHLVEEYLEIVSSILGPLNGHHAPRIELSQDDRAKADEVMGNATGRTCIALAPGAAFGSAKRWPPESFAKLAEMLVKRLGAAVYLFGGPAEVPTMHAITRSTDVGLNVAAGKYDLMVQAAMIAACDVCVANDSGLMHLAAAMDTTVVGLFGPTDPVRTRPYGPDHTVIQFPMDCAPCQLKLCHEDHRCMRAITPEIVFREVEKNIET